MTLLPDSYSWLLLICILSNSLPAAKKGSLSSTYPSQGTGSHGQTLPRQGTCLGRAQHTGTMHRGLVAEHPQPSSWAELALEHLRAGYGLTKSCLGQVGDPALHSVWPPEAFRALGLCLHMPLLLSLTPGFLSLGRRSLKFCPTHGPEK